MTTLARAVDFLRLVVEPDRYDAFQNPESIRHGFHFCVSLFSLRDWVFNEFATRPGWNYGASIREFQTYLELQNPEYAIISDIANAAKHLHLKHSYTKGVAGADHIAVFGSAAISGSAISSMPTLEVVVGGKVYQLLFTAEQVLMMWQKLFVENNWD